MKAIYRLIFLILFWVILFLIHGFIYLAAARVYEGTIPHAFLWLLGLSFSFILANILGRTFDGKLVSFFYFITASLLGVMFIMFSAVAIYEIIGLFIPGDSTLLFSILFGGGIISSIYALINGRRLVVKEISIPVKNLESKVRIVHLSDVHIGTVHQIKFLNEVVQKTNALNPDMVLMTGDLFDGSEPIHEEMLRPLDEINAPTYFSIGNHEEYEGLQKVRSTIQNLKMNLLDSKIVEEKGIQIIGVNDRQSLPKDVTLDSILQKLDINREKPSILMYHTPVEWESARKNKIDLTLSGHTHNGQIYPFNLLVRLQFKYINGLYAKEGKYLHVSPGTGTWGPPMRLGSRNQITVIDLV
jgi:predicted MPP superfamily phosphohydrolase